MRRLLCALGLHAFAYHRHPRMGGVITHRYCRRYNCACRQRWRLVDGVVTWSNIK